MAEFHMEAKIVSRGAGRSVVAAAAYASCSELYNDYDGLTHDFTRKQGCRYSAIFLPPQAPPEWQDRQTLWNAVESVEKTKNSRLARELVMALPLELGLEEWKHSLTEFIQTQCVALGMCADVSIHDTDGHNPHAHLLLTVRPLDEQGRWQAKTQKEYLCRRGDAEQGFTAQEFAAVKTQGWEKQYQYKIGRKQEYRPPSQAEWVPGIKRLSKSPKATRFGRQNPISEVWNSEEQLVRWRTAWAEVENRELARHSRPERVDSRSFADRGIDTQPTVHEGYSARKLEQMGLVADRCELNRQIKADNKLLRELKAKLQALAKAAAMTVQAIAAKLESLWAVLVLSQYQLAANVTDRDRLRKMQNQYAPVMQKYRQVRQKIREKTTEQKALQAEKKACKPIQVFKVRDINKQLAALLEKIEELKSRKSALLAKMYCNEDKQVPEIVRQLAVIQKTLPQLETQRGKLMEQARTAFAEYAEVRNTVAPEDETELLKERQHLRPDKCKTLLTQLHDAYGKDYNAEYWRAATRLVDVDLQDPVPEELSESLRQKLLEAKREQERMAQYRAQHRSQDFDLSR